MHIRTQTTDSTKLKRTSLITLRIAWQSHKIHNANLHWISEFKEALHNSDRGIQATRAEEFTKFACVSSNNSVAVTYCLDCTSTGDGIKVTARSGSSAYRDVLGWVNNVKVKLANKAHTPIEDDAIPVVEAFRTLHKDNPMERSVSGLNDNLCTISCKNIETDLRSFDDVI